MGSKISAQEFSLQLLTIKKKKLKQYQYVTDGEQ